MNGNKFKQIMMDSGYTQTSLAERWGLVRQTIGAICGSDVVEPIYADAIAAVAYEQQAEKLRKTLGELRDLTFGSRLVS